MIITEHTLEELNINYKMAPKNHIKHHIGRRLKELRTVKLRQEVEAAKRERERLADIARCQAQIKSEESRHFLLIASLLKPLKALTGRLV